MKSLVISSVLIGVLFAGFLFIPSAFAQYSAGGVDDDGTWYVGEGLKEGDFFSYDLCHVDYKECSDFQMDLWIGGTITVGSEEKWLAQVVVYDGKKIVKGTMELGKIAPEPSGGSSELGVYRGAFKSSVVWLSAYATKNTPVAFAAPSWGKIANIGGEQILPTAIETTVVPDGTYETVRVQWKTGGAQSKVWVVDDFPFPIKASTWVHVSEGIPPQEYNFQLLDYQQYVNSDPFVRIQSTNTGGVAEGCPAHYELTPLATKTTKNGKYLIEYRYGPSEPSKGCEIEWFINFKNKFDQTEFLNQVQYDILVVDENLTPLRSFAQEDGRNFFFSGSGQVLRDTLVKEDSGTAHYVIWIYGLSPQNVVPSGTPDFIQINIPIGGVVTPPTPPPTDNGLDIPSWIKNNAGWWSSDQIQDSDFVSGIQFLINQGIMKIPPTTPGVGTGSNEIPSWIKNNAGWWANDQISDQDFVLGIQYLIENGIMKIA